MYDSEVFINKSFIEQEYRYGEICRYVERYIESYRKDNDRNDTLIKTDQTIWLLWYQGREKAPALVKKCIESVVNNCPQDFDVIVLDKNNLSEYVKLPSYIIEKYNLGKITDTHYSDIIRAYLLFHYGGCWIDATVYCMERIPSVFLSGTAFMFKTESVICDPVIKASSWWIFAKRKNKLFSYVYQTLLNYWEKETVLIDYFLFHLIISILVTNNKECKQIFNNSFYFNSGNAHVLYSKLEKEYKSDEWDRIKFASPIQKLSYKKRYLRGDTNSNYMHIISSD